MGFALCMTDSLPISFPRFSMPVVPSVIQSAVPILMGVVTVT
jgi:hypothetical protein